MRAADLRRGRRADQRGGGRGGGGEAAERQPPGPQQLRKHACRAPADSTSNVNRRPARTANVNGRHQRQPLGQPQRQYRQHQHRRHQHRCRQWLLQRRLGRQLSSGRAGRRGRGDHRRGDGRLLQLAAGQLRHGGPRGRHLLPVRVELVPAGLFRVERPICRRYRRPRRRPASPFAAACPRPRSGSS